MCRCVHPGARFGGGAPGASAAGGRAELVEFGLGPAPAFGVLEGLALGCLGILESLFGIDAGLNRGGDVLGGGQALVVEFAGLVNEGFGDVLGDWCMDM